MAIAVSSSLRTEKIKWTNIGDESNNFVLAASLLKFKALCKVKNNLSNPIRSIAPEESYFTDNCLTSVVHL